MRTCVAVLNGVAALFPRRALVCGCRVTEPDLTLPAGRALLQVRRAAYRPEGTVTRAEMAVSLAKALGLHWADSLNLVAPDQ